MDRGSSNCDLGYLCESRTTSPEVSLLPVCTSAILRWRDCLSFLRRYDAMSELGGNWWELA